MRNLPKGGVAVQEAVKTRNQGLRPPRPLHQMLHQGRGKEGDHPKYISHPSPFPDPRLTHFSHRKRRQTIQVLRSHLRSGGVAGRVKTRNRKKPPHSPPLLQPARPQVNRAQRRNGAGHPRKLSSSSLPPPSLALFVPVSFLAFLYTRSSRQCTTTDTPSRVSTR